jgi:hypothetical protein
VPSKDTPAAEQTGGGAASFGHEAPLSIDIGVAHVARVYGYWLGGKDNFAADRMAGEQAIQAYPDIVYSVRANRAFLARTVRYLAKDAGIRQFLDIGTGIPTANNTHEVAQSVAPGCSVVYVDNDPVVLAHAQALLLSGEQGTPVTSMPACVQEWRPNAEEAKSPAALWEVWGARAAMRERLNRLVAQKGTYRTRDEVTRLFDGLELVEPGMVRIQQWRPESEIQAKAAGAMWGGSANSAGRERVLLRGDRQASHGPNK